MGNLFSVACANPNIAFIKYWGDRDPVLRIPSNGSISMNLDGLLTRTQVTLDSKLSGDKVFLNNLPLEETSLERVVKFLDRVRQLAEKNQYFRVESSNNFPAAAGIASSASAFAALSLAAMAACGLRLDEVELSRLARTGSGSACRSIPGGFVEWQAGDSHESSYATSFAPLDHWDLCDCIAILSVQPKPISSSLGHSLATTSSLQNARLDGVNARLDQCRNAILERDFDAFAEVVELDSNLMHAVMMTSSPPLFYWLPSTLALIQAVKEWRTQGMPVCYTIDAGPNVHVICLGEFVNRIKGDLESFPGVSLVLVAHPGGPARLET